MHAVKVFPNGTIPDTTTIHGIPQPHRLNALGMPMIIIITQEPCTLPSKMAGTYLIHLQPLLSSPRNIIHRNVTRLIPESAVSRHAIAAITPTVWMMSYWVVIRMVSASMKIILGYTSIFKMTKAPFKDGLLMMESILTVTMRWRRIMRQPSMP